MFSRWNFEKSNMSSEHLLSIVQSKLIGGEILISVSLQKIFCSSLWLFFIDNNCIQLVSTGLILFIIKKTKKVLINIFSLTALCY